MKKILFKLVGAFTILCFLSPDLAYGQASTTANAGPVAEYSVERMSKPITIDANWNKRAWKKVKALKVNRFVRDIPAFKPEVEAKMAYDDHNIYVIFRVKDRFVRTVTTTINGPVWKDSAVEFFFSPDTAKPLDYFNLEVNSGGTPLLQSKGGKPTVEDIRQIEIAHSMPKTTDPEITDPVTWFIEYRIPISMLEKYSNVTRPAKGIVWKGNFYKIAEITSNPHHATWAEIRLPRPTFHTPAFFGRLVFQ